MESKTYEINNIVILARLKIGNRRTPCKYCVHMYVSGEIIPVETVPGMVDRVNSSMIYLIKCKNL
jgi:hypothetical protein